MWRKIINATNPQSLGTKAKKEEEDDVVLSLFCLEKIKFGRVRINILILFSVALI